MVDDLKPWDEGSGAAPRVEIDFELAGQPHRLVKSFLGKKRCVLLANHGFLAATATIEESLYMSVLIERAARNQLIAQSAYGRLKLVDPVLAKESHNFLLQRSIVNASFAMFARQITQEQP